MTDKKRILVAMSGGVDSSVAAALLHEAGHDLIGVTMHLWDAEGEQKVGRCCAPEDRDDARITCEHLGIPHYVIDEREAFRTHVIEPFLDEYENGKTPSPCVNCNRTVKLLQLADLADRFGASHIATGHYAIVEQGPVLRRGYDRQKDQSYFLFGVPPAVLDRMIFPLGAMVKDHSRTEARRLGLPNADKPDSQELCFVPDGNIGGFIERERGTRDAGEIRTAAGDVIGHHPHVQSLTVGQRRGLGVGGGPARYVLRVLPDENAAVVGNVDDLLGEHMHATDVHWLQACPERPFDALVRIRYRHDPAPARVVPTENGFHAYFTEAQRAITPGQAAVVYKNDEVLGGGFISA